MIVYDMCVDYNNLCSIEDKLKKIEFNLYNSVDRMLKEIEQSQDFLAGHQYERIKTVTINCVDLTRKTIGNIEYARKYIKELQNAVEDYRKCGYSMEAE